MVLIDLQNQKRSGSYQPSSEKALHTAIYRSKPEVNAVVHTHSMYAIAFSSVNMELPVISIELMSAGWTDSGGWVLLPWNGCGWGCCDGAISTTTGAERCDDEKPWFGYFWSDAGKSLSNSRMKLKPVPRFITLLCKRGGSRMG